MRRCHRSRVRRCCLAGAWLTLAAACGRVFPLENSREVSREALEGMFLDVASWPDTLEPGMLATAEVQLLLADSTPIFADNLSWAVDSIHLAELYPTRIQESKRIRGIAPGRAVVRVRASVLRYDGIPHNGSDLYETEMTRAVIIRAPGSRQ